MTTPHQGHVLPFKVESLSSRVMAQVGLRGKLARNAFKDLENLWTVQKNAALYEDTLEKALKVD